MAVQTVFDMYQLKRAFSPLLENRALQVCEVFSGNINTIVKVDIAGQCYGLRVRTQEKVYRYEPDLIKEAFVAWLLQHAHKGPGDAEAATAFAEMRGAQCGSVANRTEVL